MQKLPFIFSILRTSYLANKSFAIVPVNTIITRILHLFVKYGVVLGVETKGHYYKVIFNYNFPFRMLIYVGATKKNTWKKASDLRRLHLPFAVVSTTQGILPLDEVQNRNLGGILLCKFESTKL